MPWDDRSLRSLGWGTTAGAGSVGEDFDAIKAAVFAVCGWADGYMNAVQALLQNLRMSCRGIVGLWPLCYGL